MKLKICFLSELPTEGKLPIGCKDLRTDTCWMKATDGTHFHLPIAEPTRLADFDICFVIIPKVVERVDICIDKAMGLIDAGLNVGMIQEGPCWYHQRWPVKLQIKFFAMLKKISILFCHNKADISYYSQLTNCPIKTILTPFDTTMFKDLKKNPKEEKIMVSGTMHEWYNGMAGIKVSEKFGLPVYYPNMGTRLGDESEYNQSNVHILPYMNYENWLNTLSTFKYGVHLMPTLAAGSFVLNCSYFGIPCIGSKGITTQEVCHPNLTVDCYDLNTTKELLEKLITDKKFYEEQSKIAIKNCKNFSLSKFKKKFYEDLKEVI